MAAIRASGFNGGEVVLEQAAIEDLKARFRGPLLFPGDAAYEQASAIWNAMVLRRPALIARCIDTADVMTGVNFAREHGIALSIKGGGHNIAGLAMCDRGMVLDMSLRRGVWVNPAERTAIAQTGCILGDVDRETQLHGLAACLGFVSKTGIAGLTLGGGFGYLTRRFGWTSDTVRSMELVSADGQLVRASEKENADLFWALRGGGGNFGVVTSIEYTLYPVGPEILGGAVAWRAEDAPGVLDMFRTLADQAPPELTVAAVIRPAPPAPWLSKEVHGKLVVLVLVCYTGPIGEGEKLLAPVKSFGSPVGDTLQRRTYVSQQSLLDATQPDGRRYYWKSEYLRENTPEISSKLLDHSRRIVSPHSAGILFQLGGALNRLGGDHSAVGNRDATYLLNITASWESASDDAANIEWARAAWRDMRSFSTGGTYINFLTEEEGETRIHDAFGQNYDRLVEVKRKWDGENFFRANKNIAPL